MGVLKTWEVGEIKGNPQSQSKKGLKVEVKKKGGRGQKYKVLGTGCLGCDLSLKLNRRKKAFLAIILFTGLFHSLLRSNSFPWSYLFSLFSFSFPEGRQDL